MDLAFQHFRKRSSRRLRIAPDFGALLAGLAARQTASPTSMAQAGLRADRAPIANPMVALFADADERARPPCGTFNPRVASMLTGDKPT